MVSQRALVDCFGLSRAALRAAARRRDRCRWRGRLRVRRVWRARLASNLAPLSKRRSRPPRGLPGRAEVGRYTSECAHDAPSLRRVNCADTRLYVVVQERGPARRKGKARRPGQGGREARAPQPKLDTSDHPTQLHHRWRSTMVQGPAWLTGARAKLARASFPATPTQQAARIPLHGGHV